MYLQNTMLANSYLGSNKKKVTTKLGVDETNEIKVRYPLGHNLVSYISVTLSTQLKSDFVINNFEGGISFV